MVEQALERREADQQGSAESITAVAVVDGDLVCTMVNDAFCALLERPLKNVIGQPITAFTGWFGAAVSQFPFASVRDGVVTTLAIGPAEPRRLLLSCSAGRSQAEAPTYLLTVTTLAHTLSPDQLLAYTTQLERSVVAGRHEVARSREAANGLRKLLYMSISNRPLDEMLDYIYEQAQHLLGAIGMTVLWAPGFAIAMSAPEQAEILYAAGAGLLRQPLLDAPLLAQLNAQQAPIFLPPPLGEASDGIAASLVAPLLVDGAIHGLVVFDLANRAPPNAIQEALWLADEVIVAHGADRLQQKAKTASALQERERLAREMHDAAMQSIYSITLFAEAGRRLASLGQIDRVQDYLQQLNETAQLALKELRLLLYELQPAVLEQVGLVGALRQRLESVERRTGMTARLEVDGDFNFPSFMEDGLYRICQEALNNALKHASASEVKVSLGVRNGEVRLEICDNGIGFNADDPKLMSGEGMTTMRERVRLMHAKLFIESAPQKGACVRVLMLIPNSAEQPVELFGLSTQGGAM
jgi:signal transduction histidine kinase